MKPITRQETEIFNSLTDKKLGLEDIQKATGIESESLHKYLERMIISGVIGFNGVVYYQKEQPLPSYNFTIEKVRAHLGFDNCGDVDFEHDTLFPNQTSLYSLFYQLTNFMTERRGSFVEFHENDSRIVFDTSDLTFTISVEKIGNGLTEAEKKEIEGFVENLPKGN